MAVGQIIWIVTIVIVVFSIGYFIWFNRWNRQMEKLEEEILMKYRKRQYETLLYWLSGKDEEDA